MSSYAPNGDVLAANDSVNGNWTYSYDAFNRLVGANQNSGAAIYSYVYDRFGNRWQQNGPVFNSVNFTGNNPTTPANTNRIDGYSYDTAGNVIGDGTLTYSYDAENHLIAVSGGSTNVTYTYDAFGRRVQKSGNTIECGSGGIVWYFYDIFDRPVVYWPSSNTNNCHTEVFAGNRHLATYQGGLNFSTADWLGTERVRHAYGDNATIKETCTSLPFGDNMPCTSTESHYASPLHFTGKERDSESGLDNFAARQNSPILGRFMSPDDTEAFSTLGDPEGLNLYSYVQNNPTNAVDPDGHDCVYIVGGTAGLLRGDCQSDKDNGIFIDGSISSFTYNQETNQIEFTFSNDEEQTGGAGAISLGPPPPSPNSNSGELNPFALGVFTRLNQMNILNNTLKIYGAGAVIGLSGGAACYYFCPAATVTTLGIATSPLLPIVPSALEKLQRIGLSVQEATAIVESPTTEKVIDNLNAGNINNYAEVGGKLVRITTNPEGTRIISAGFARANQITNGIANGRFLPK